MAPSAVVESAESTILDKIEKPPSDVVLPPKDIRAIVEKTAGYVARNGAVFEDRIRQKEISNPKFSFLSANDAYNSFYTWRLNEVRAGRGNAVSAGRAAEDAPALVPEKPKGPEPPPEFHFSARMPNINAQDLDVVRLTALFVAKNGRSFMTALSQRESANYQFDFLRPQHSLYQFFSRLVDQYSELLNALGTDAGKAEKARMAELNHNIQDRFHLLGRAKQRAEWVRFQEQQKQQNEEAKEAEHLAYAQIDWHDFVVVETVLFDEADDQADLPPPTSLNDLQSASLEQKGMMSLQPHSMRIEEAMPTDFDYNPYHQQQQVPQHPQPHLPYAPPYPQYPTQAPAPPTENSEDALIRERTETRDRASAAQALARGSATAPMKIRSDYIPRAQQQRGRQGQMGICPNCKGSFLYDELAEHMRIELLDPRWKEQRAKAESRYATTNLSTADVANNLKRLASQRTDVFDGVTGEPISEEELARRKRAATSYDGVIGGDGGGADSLAARTADAMAAARVQQMQTMNIEEQLRHIREKAGR